jgi:hypothetical protein
MTRGEKEQMRDRFLKELAEETKLSITQIRKILRESGFTSFEMDKKPTYRATVLAYSGAYRRVEKELTNSSKPQKCLMPNCDGVRVKGDSAFGWICTEGGKRHFLAYTVAQATGQDPKEALITLTDLAGKAAERDEKARQEWLKAMKEDDTTTIEDTEK